MRLCRGSTVINFCLFMQEKRGVCPYEIDGVVIKVNEIDIQRVLGIKARFPGGRLPANSLIRDHHAQED